MKSIVVLLTLFCLCQVQNAKGSGCPRGWIKSRNSGRCYFISKSLSNWPGAKRHCESMNSQLAPVLSCDDKVDLNAALVFHRKTCPGKICMKFWIGMTQKGEGWTTAKDVAIDGKRQCLYWSKGFPRPDRGKCGVMSYEDHWRRGNWRNDACKIKQKYVCVRAMQIIQSASGAPYDAVAKFGEDVSFTCSGKDYMPDTGYFAWTVYPSRLVVYQHFGDKPESFADPSKYIVINSDGASVLIVKGVTRNDHARTYCFFSQLMTKNVCANLVVIETLIASVNPSTELTVGQVVNLTCVLNYWGPTTDPEKEIKPLSADQNPHLTMAIGCTPITDMPPELTIIGPDGAAHEKTISINRTIVARDDDQSIVCKVTTTNPAFSYANSTYLRLK